LQAQHEALRQQFPPWAGQRDFSLFPNVMLHNLAVGALSIVPDLPQGRLAQLDPARIAAQLDAERVETLTGNVFYFTALVTYLRLHPATFPAVRAVGIGGSPVPESLLAAVQRHFPRATCHVIYGASEAEPIAVRAVAGPAPDPRLGYCVGQPHAALELQLRQPQPVWQPVAQHELVAAEGGYVRAALGQQFLATLDDEFLTYQSGEILVRGPHVAVPNGPKDWLATGDFGYFDDAGQLWLTGRRGAARLVRGVGHYQLEHHLRHLPGVAQVAALPRADGSAFDVFFVGMTTAESIQIATDAAFGPGLLGHVQQREQLPVDGRHFSKLRYDLIR
jgi:acyl-coenzyme A synthetase/AMP-(fatty) acid ligase